MGNSRPLDEIFSMTWTLAKEESCSARRSMRSSSGKALTTCPLSGLQGPLHRGAKKTNPAGPRANRVWIPVWPRAATGLRRKSLLLFRSLLLGGLLLHGLFLSDFLLGGFLLGCHSVLPP